MKITISGGPGKGPKFGVGLHIKRDGITLDWWLVTPRQLAAFDAQTEKLKGGVDGWRAEG